MPAWIWAFLLFFSILFAAKLIYVVFTGWSMAVTRGALFVPTHRVRIEAVMDAVPMQPGDLFVDLGCGDGRVLRAVRKRYGVKASGIADLPPSRMSGAREAAFVSDRPKCGGTLKGTPAGVILFARNCTRQEAGPCTRPARAFP